MSYDVKNLPLPVRKGILLTVLCACGYVTVSQQVPCLKMFFSTAVDREAAWYKRAICIFLLLLVMLIWGAQLKVAVTAMRHKG